jgi:crotonobetainyl-CoA:carnitine CoA-transferase CaiB-like acyl-CoA transferase
MGANSNKLWQTLCEVLERPDIFADSRFKSIADRLLHRVALIEALEKSFAARNAADWIDILLAAGIPAGPILNYAEALASEHAQARAVVMEMDHPVEGKVKSIGFPVKLSETNQRVRLPPPLLGQHNDEILAELGIDEKTRAQLRAEGAQP